MVKPRKRRKKRTGLSSASKKVRQMKVARKISRINRLSQLRAIACSGRRSDCIKKIISKTDFRRLMKHAPKWLGRVCICSWCTGLRKTEILSLQWKEVNLSERLIVLDPSKIMGEGVRLVGIEGEILDVLIEIQTENGRPSPDDNVFLSEKGKKINVWSFDMMFRKIVDKVGLRDIVFHDFRRNYIARKIYSE
jgi:integrase